MSAIIIGFQRQTEITLNLLEFIDKLHEAIVEAACRLRDRFSIAVLAFRSPELTDELHNRNEVSRGDNHDIQFGRVLSQSRIATHGGYERTFIGHKHKRMLHCGGNQTMILLIGKFLDVLPDRKDMPAQGLGGSGIVGSLHISQIIGQRGLRIDGQAMSSGKRDYAVGP